MPDRAVGKLERLAYERAERDHERWTATTQDECTPDGYWWDDEQAERSIIFTEAYCVHYKGRQFAGKPLVLEEWQRFQRREVFGWRDVEGNRRFSTWWQEVARKNGKSTDGGATGLYMLVADGEPGGEVYSVATKRDQAKIIFLAAREMAKRAPPELKDVLDIMKMNINVPRLTSKFEPLSSDYNTLDGLNPHAMLVDEIHAHRDRSLWNVLVSAMGSREQPLICVFTTAGVYDPEQVGWQEHEYACKVLEGVFEDESYFAFICAADDDDDWDSDAALEKANPNIGVSVRRKYLDKERKKARQQPAARNPYIRYHTNRWTQTLDLWLKLEDWRGCTVDPLGWVGLRGEKCWGGLDLSTKLDLTSAAYAFPRVIDDVTYWELLVMHYMPEDRIELGEQEDRAPYQKWVDEGWIIATPGTVIDYEFIERDIRQMADMYDLQEMAYDPYNATGLAGKLEQTWGLPMVLMRQGFASMSEPCKDFEAQVVAHRIIAAHNPLLTWQANNTVAVQDAAANVKLDKKASRKRIDGIVASCMAVGRGYLAVNEAASVYETRGITSIGAGHED